MGCIVNTASIVEHDCVIGDFVNLSPKTAMAGHTKIGNKSFLGIGCTIIDAITVDKESVIGAGAVVSLDVPEHAVVAAFRQKESVRQKMKRNDLARFYSLTVIRFQ